MKKFICIFFISFIAFLKADIFEIKEIAEIEKYVSSNPLVVFDLDNTLIETYQTLGSDQWFYNRMNEYKKNGKNDGEAFELTYPEWFQIQCVTKVRAVEKDTLKFFQQMQKKHSVMALTTRSFDLNFTTFLQLKSVGLDFSKCNFSDKTLFFEGDKYVVYKDGILFANGTNKGQALAKLFKAVNLNPKEIVFVDDRENHLKDVENFCKANEIKFTGLRYAYLDEKIKNFDHKLAKKQFAHFGKILTDEEASLLIN